MGHRRGGGGDPGDGADGEQDEAKGAFQTPPVVRKGGQGRGGKQKVQEEARLRTYPGLNLRGRRVAIESRRVVFVVCHRCVL